MLREHKNTISFAKNNVAHFDNYFILTSTSINIYNLFNTNSNAVIFKHH